MTTKRGVITPSLVSTVKRSPRRFTACTVTPRRGAMWCSAAYACRYCTTCSRDGQRGAAFGQGIMGRPEAARRRAPGGGEVWAPPGSPGSYAPTCWGAGGRGAALGHGIMGGPEKVLVV